MAWWNPGSWGRTETRAVTLDSLLGGAGDGFASVFGLGERVGDVVVNIDTAMQVPAFSCGVLFIAETVGGLPLDYYRRGADGSRREGEGPLTALLKDAANDTLTSFEWRKGEMVKKLTGGRGLTYIERDERGRPINFWPLDPAKTTIRRDGFGFEYVYNNGGRRLVYRASEVIDLPFMLCADGVKHRSPVRMGAKAIGKSLAAMEYGTAYFNGGGVPPFAITGNFQSGRAMQAAADDVAAAVRKAKSEKRLALTLPTGLEIKPLGSNPEDSQMIESLRFSIEEIARLLKIPPVFLQDLTHGTFANTEQQDLHFVKHTLMHHVKQFEQELNLKLFGRANRRHYVEFNVDGIMRGDFRNRMEGWARAIQTGLVMPNEARRAENYPDAEGGDKLFMQSATMPIGEIGQAQPGTGNDGSADGAADQGQGE